MQCEGLTCLLGDCQVAFLEILQVFLSFTRSTFDHSCKELPQIGRNIQLFESIKSQCGRGGGEFVVQSYRTFLQSHKQGRNNPSTANTMVQVMAVMEPKWVFCSVSLGCCFLSWNMHSVLPTVVYGNIGQFILIIRQFLMSRGFFWILRASLSSEVTCLENTCYSPLEAHSSSNQ